MLRQKETFGSTSVAASDPRRDVEPHAKGSLQLEMLVTFSWSGAAPTHKFGVSVAGGNANVTIDCTTKAPDAPCMVTTPATGPLLPMGTTTVSVHAILDHEILETIVNNRTAMVTYHKNIPSPDATDVFLFGTGNGIQAEIKTWNLDSANNAGPQP